MCQDTSDWPPAHFSKATHLQAVNAVQTFNGTDLAGRKILVREDREDRDVKQYNKDNGIEPPEREARPPRRERRSREPQANTARDGPPPRTERRHQENASSGLQVLPILQEALLPSVHLSLTSFAASSGPCYYVEDP